MIVRIFIFLTMALISLGCLAQTTFTRPADAIKYRQAAFQVMSFHSQRVGSMAKGERPFDKTVINQDATVLELLSAQMESAFPPGTDSAPSKTKAEVWQDPAQFRQKMEDFKLATRKLSEASRSGDLNSIRHAFNQTAQSCKSCHEGFRNR